MSTTEYVESYLENAKSLRLRLMCEKEYLDGLENLVAPWMRTLIAGSSADARLDADIVRVRSRIRALEDELSSVAATFGKLPGVEADVMKMRYLEGRGWRYIADKTYYSPEYVGRDMHKRCKKHLAALI